ncbi:hypothetical protein RJ033_14955, partial [Brucella melitensis]|nr:hypothetical protein [Brucella melitensis]
KCETVFGKDARQNKGLERRSDSIRSKRALKRVEFKSNHHPAPRFCLRMIPKNRFALLSERLQLH